MILLRSTVPSRCANLLAVADEFHVPAAGCVPGLGPSQVHRALPITRPRAELLICKYGTDLHIHSRGRDPHSPTRGITTAARTGPIITDIDRNLIRGERSAVAIRLDPGAGAVGIARAVR